MKASDGILKSFTGIQSFGRFRGSFGVVSRRFHVGFEEASAGFVRFSGRSGRSEKTYEEFQGNFMEVSSF